MPDGVEGFGIVALEAGSCGLPVVASNIQGLQDAVIDGKTGYLVEEGDVDGFVGRITDMNLKKDQIREIVNSTFDWQGSQRNTRTLFSAFSSPPAGSLEDMDGPIFNRHLPSLKKNRGRLRKMSVIPAKRLS